LAPVDGNKLPQSIHRAKAPGANKKEIICVTVQKKKPMVCHHVARLLAINGQMDGIVIAVMRWIVVQKQSGRGAGRQVGAELRWPGVERWK